MTILRLTVFVRDVFSLGLRLHVTYTDYDNDGI